jgi:hypothetical protein
LETLGACGKNALAREAAAGPMLYPAPEIPDDTPIENVRFSTRVRNALTTAGVKTLGETEHDEEHAGTARDFMSDFQREHRVNRRWLRGLCLPCEPF